MTSAVQGAQHTAFREDLRQDDGRLGAWRIVKIERHAGAAIVLQQGGDGGIAIGPIGDHVNDILGGESAFNAVTRQDRLLIDQTGDAPGCGGVDKDRAVCGAQAGELVGVIGLARFAGLSGGGGSCAAQQADAVQAASQHDQRQHRTDDPSMGG